MASYINAGDLRTIFVNYFLGNQALLPFAFILFISLLAGYFQLSNKVFLMVLAIGSVMGAAYIGEAYYFVILMLVGFVVYKALSRIFQ